MESPGRTILTNARVINGLGDTFRGFVAIDGSKIVGVGEGQPERSFDEFETIDAGDMTVMPGFIDCHVHLRTDGVPDPRAQVLSDSEAMSTIRSARNARRSVEAGITTVRDCGSRNFIDVSIKKAIQDGIIPGPRMVISGMIICMTGGHGWQVGLEADGVEGVRQAARRMLKAGVDNIKLVATGGILTEGTEIGAPQYSIEEMRAGVEEARKAGRIVAAHAHGKTGIKNAVRAGVDSIEHGYFLDEEGIELMLKFETYLVGTSAAVRNVASHGVKDGLRESVHRKASEAVEHHIEGFGQAYRAGVELAMGTDSGVPFTHHGNNLDELVHMVDMGLSPMEAIEVATLKSAKLLRLDNQIGSIELGKLADLVVFDGDPLSDIALLRDKDRMHRVIQNGRTVIIRDQPNRRRQTKPVHVDHGAKTAHPAVAAN